MTFAGVPLGRPHGTRTEMILRTLVLIVGPVLLIAGSYCLTVGRDHVAQAASAPSVQPEFNLERLRDGARAGLSDNESTSGNTGGIDLLCDERARKLSRHLNSNDGLIVRAPFILAGDLSEAELNRYWHEIIVPTRRALELAYFDARANEPITLLLYASETKYRAAAQRLDGHESADYYGYYIRNDRRIVANVGTGEGTLAHELTHALSHFDFPHMPEWFDEGLASVYEEAEFSDDNLHLTGLSNWRLNHLLNALQNRRLQTLESLVTARDIRPDRQAVDYAHARYFCLYLQERELLPAVYRKLRANSARDPSGLRTLCQIFDTPTLDPVDRDFREWVIRLYEQTQTRK